MVGNSFEPLTLMVKLPREYRDLKSTAILIAINLYRRAGKELRHDITVSIETLARDCGVSKKTIMRSDDTLIKKGLISCERGSQMGSKKSNTYMIDGLINFVNNHSSRTNQFQSGPNDRSQSGSNATADQSQISGDQYQIDGDQYQSDHTSLPNRDTQENGKRHKKDLHLRDEEMTGEMARERFQTFEDFLTYLNNQPWRKEAGNIETLKALFKRMVASNWTSRGVTVGKLKPFVIKNAKTFPVPEEDSYHPCADTSGALLQERQRMHAERIRREKIERNT